MNHSKKLSKYDCLGNLFILGEHVNIQQNVSLWDILGTCNPTCRDKISRNNCKSMVAASDQCELGAVCLTAAAEATPDWFITAKPSWSQIHSGSHLTLYYQHIKIKAHFIYNLKKGIFSLLSSLILCVLNTYLSIALQVHHQRLCFSDSHPHLGPALPFLLHLKVTTQHTVLPC